MRRSGMIAMALACMMLASCQPMGKSLEADGFVKMSGLRMNSALVGNTLSGTDSEGTYSIFYPERGKFRAMFSGKRATGTWEARDGFYCRKWDNLEPGSERCFAFYTRGDELIWSTRNGQRTERGMLRKGNPEKL